jgi:hypothetical protein
VIAAKVRLVGKMAGIVKVVRRLQLCRFRQQICLYRGGAGLAEADMQVERLESFHREPQSACFSVRRQRELFHTRELLDGRFPGLGQAAVNR